MLEVAGFDASQQIVNVRSRKNSSTSLNRRVFLPYAALKWLCVLVDASLIVLAGALGFVGYQMVAGGSLADYSMYLGAGALAAVLYALAAHSTGLYKLYDTYSPRLSAKKVIFNWTIVCSLLLAVTFLMKSSSQFSRGSVVSAALIALALLLLSQWIASKFCLTAIASGRVRGRRVVLFGSREELSGVDPDSLLRTFGLSEIGRVAFPSTPTGGLRITPSENEALERALEMVRAERADELVVSLPWNDSRKLLLFRERLRCFPLPVQLLPDLRIRSLLNNPHFNAKPSFAFEFQRGPLSRSEQLVKRLCDIAGASLGLFAFAPIMLIAAAAIKLDSEGPVFFRQRRNGFNTKQFLIFKFRSMAVCEDGPQIVQAKRGDSRVTRVGALLRRSSIDELPQLLNVLRGEMSLVGPRPHALAHDDYYGQLISEYATGTT
jgi:undecaprenyl-phosphate galactose phosphotransferase/putative colanic acid biosynthesis UDP-glucose lipid carrier transferase